MTWHDYFIYLFICRSQLKSELVTVKTLGRKLIVRLSQIRDASSLQTSHGDQRSTSAVEVPIELKILAWLTFTSHVSHLVILTRDSTVDIASRLLYYGVDNNLVGQLMMQIRYR